MMTNHGFAPGILDYWVLLSDWRNGSFAILLASVLFVGYVLATGYKTLAVKDSQALGGDRPARAFQLDAEAATSAIRAAEDKGLRYLLVAPFRQGLSA